MSAAAQRSATAFLRRAGLVAAVLAIIAGIFGMHVMTGHHATHSPAFATASAHDHDTAPTDQPGHRSRDSTGSDPAVVAGPVGLMVAAESCQDPGSCSMQAMTAACTPSPKTPSLDAPPPGSLVLAVSNNTTAGPETGRWTYLPDSPSPCELSISRT
ncbi:hypothetical protein [Arthrobacter sp. ISL-65]|uniref:hypothetical protein n=1 Tax=Arthrobacter sp. ISL-65 TaxID=2819112 RepID=UPI001BE90D77|nr:hypothetical protein [Arthrobacter sp. ISL-65]MBT2548982.1 hypothetical protein [Arthrobacter sp. ISL-65]